MPDREVGAELAPSYASKTDVVCALIREMIISGEAEAGSPLRQRDLAQRFRVSQTPVREALRRLESEGLVHNDPHRGATVVDSQNPGDDNARVRVVLEGLAARLAAERVSPAEVDELRALNECMFTMTDDDPAYIGANRDFHFRICELAGSPILMSLMRLLWQAMPRGPMVFRSHRDSAAEHEQLIDALAGHDGDKAADLVDRHILGDQRR